MDWRVWRAQVKGDCLPERRLTKEIDYEEDIGVNNGLTFCCGWRGLRSRWRGAACRTRERGSRSSSGGRRRLHLWWHGHRWLSVWLLLLTWIVVPFLFVKDKYFQFW